MFSNLSRKPTVGYQPLPGMADDDQKDDERVIPTEERIDHIGEHNRDGGVEVVDPPEDVDDERVVLTEEDVCASPEDVLDSRH